MEEPQSAGVALITPKNDEPGNTDQVIKNDGDKQEPIKDKEEDLVPKKDFYKIYGELKKAQKTSEEMAKEIQQLKTLTQKPEVIDHGDYDEAQVQFVDKLVEKRATSIAEKKFDELFLKRQQTELQQKEENEFLKANPEAREYLDPIYNFKKMVDPTVSLSQAWKGLRKMYDLEPERETQLPTNMGGGGNVPAKSGAGISDGEAYGMWLGLNK